MDRFGNTSILDRCLILYWKRNRTSHDTSLVLWRDELKGDPVAEASVGAKQCLFYGFCAGTGA